MDAEYHVAHIQSPADAGEVAERAARQPEGMRSGRRENSAYPQALDRAEVDLVDSTSKSDTSDPGGMPQLFRKSFAPDTRFRRTQRAAARKQRAAQKSALKMTTAGRPRRKTGDPPLLRKHEHKIRQGGVTNTGAILQVAQRAREEDNGEERKEVAVHRAG
jgi:hypothetical protein